MTDHRQAALAYLTSLLWCAADEEGPMSDYEGAAKLALNSLAPLLTADPQARLTRAEADARIRQLEADLAATLAANAALVQRLDEARNLLGKLHDASSKVASAYARKGGEGFAVKESHGPIMAARAFLAGGAA